MVMTEHHGQMGAHMMKTCLDEMATHLVNRPCGIPMMRGTFGVSKGVARAALTQRWDSILVWGVQRVKAAAIMNYWRAAAFLLASLGSDGPGSGSGVAEPAVPDSRLLEYRTGTLDGISWMMPWIEFLSGRTCILLWILYGNMVDFSFIVSLYVSDLCNVTIEYSYADCLRSSVDDTRARWKVCSGRFIATKSRDLYS